MTATRAWIDTDVGGNPDDLLALACALAHPRVELVGVSTVSGDPDWRVVQARAVVGDAVPVIAGPPRPEVVRGVDVLVAIGPWSHVAQLAIRDSLPARVVCMGGAVGTVEHRGERMRVEHNIGVDPAAAARVCELVDGLVVVPLDVTARLVVPPDVEARLRRALPVLGEHVDRWRRARGDHPLCLHDPLAVLVAAGDAPVTLAPRTLSVDSLGTMTAAAGTRHELVVDADPALATARVVELLGA